MLSVMIDTYFSGEICPCSGIWYTEESGEKFMVSKGERFPALNNKDVYWKLKKEATPELILEDQLRVRAEQILDMLNSIK